MKLRLKSIQDHRPMNAIIGEGIAARLKLPDEKAAEVLEKVMAEGIDVSDFFALVDADPSSLATEPEQSST